MKGIGYSYPLFFRRMNRLMYCQRASAPFYTRFIAGVSNGKRLNSVEKSLKSQSGQHRSKKPPVALKKLDLPGTLATGVHMAESDVRVEGVPYAELIQPAFDSK